MTVEQYEKLLMKRNHGKVASSEHELQCTCVSWFRLAYPNQIIMAIPNGGYRTATTAALMKAEGQLAGVPDLFIPIPRGEFHGLWIEMKNGKAGRLSDAQKRMITRLRNENYMVEVVRTPDEFMKTITEYMK